MAAAKLSDRLRGHADALFNGPCNASEVRPLWEMVAEVAALEAQRDALRAAFLADLRESGRL